MMPPTPVPHQHRVQRWIVRRGPLIAAIVITVSVAAKTLSLIFAILGFPLTRTDFLGVLETVDQVSWPLAIFMLLISWMLVFLGVPLWQTYLAYEHRRRLSEEEDPQAGHLSQRARTKRSQSRR